MHPSGKHLIPKPTTKKAAAEMIKLIVTLFIENLKKGEYKDLSPRENI